ncbi:MAG: type II toxin-antitoxin system prevent-host-death family antitoxin [Thermodesulfovibrio sp.]|nr:type II toxin-antitoxin system prevent-host-death family antitoxin [Thermodesulfovibrio sp.]
MEHIGIRDLKNKLSSCLSRVQKGERIIVTDHGVEVAIITPVSPERRAMLSLVKDGRAEWSGNKPKGCDGVKIKGKSIAETVMEERQ